MTITVEFEIIKTATITARLFGRQIVVGLVRFLFHTYLCGHDCDSLIIKWDLGAARDSNMLYGANSAVKYHAYIYRY